MSDGNYVHGDYTGDGKALFFLALRTGLLTFFTLGIYRFWAKTRIRRFIWLLLIILIFLLLALSIHFAKPI